MTGYRGPTARDLDALGHMMVASSWALAIAEGRNQEDFHQDLQLYLALVKAVEIVGEAATRISSATRGSEAEIPWAQIIAMRNHLVHGYDTIRRDRVWLTVQEDLPPLVEQLRRLMPDDFVPTPLR